MHPGVRNNETVKRVASPGFQQTYFGNFQKISMMYAHTYFPLELCGDVVRRNDNALNLKKISQLDEDHG